MITPVAFNRTLEGKSNAHLIRFSDGRDYVVKFFQTGFEKTLANEWVAYCLARYLGLPVPYARLVEIPQEFSTHVPELAQMNVTQFQFASIYVPECLDGHQVPTIGSITNHDTLAAIIVFDYWLSNRDRTRKNILLHEEEPDHYHLWMIDQAEIFGSYNWNLTEIENLPTEIMKSATHQIMASFIEEEQEFFEQIELIQTLPIHLIEEVVALIPEDWEVTREERKAMVSTLVTRRKKVLPEIMHLFIRKIYRPLQVKEN
jgi:hypothetical protein